MPNVYTFKDFEGSSHRILIDLIRRHAGRGGTLLDLGAAGGELGSAVREQFDRTIGFEYNVDCIGQLDEKQHEQHDAKHRQIQPKIRMADQISEALRISVRTDAPSACHALSR